MVHLILKILLLFCASNVVLGAKILGVFPLAAHSHRNLYTPLMKELIKKGHHVTIVSPFEETFSNRTVIIEFKDWLREMTKEQNVYKIVDSNAFQKIHSAVEVMTDVTEITLAQKDVQELIKSRKKFDLVILSQAINYAHHALAWYFGAPLIVFCTTRTNFWLNLMVGNSAPPSYVPDLFAAYYGHMSFFERIVNTATYIYTKICTYRYVYLKQNQLIKKYIPGGPNIKHVLHNVSLVLLNSDSSINQPVPHLSNMIGVGGFHIKPPKKLPADLQDYMDNAENGVIYFSMGSNLRSSELLSDQRDAFLKTFSKLKQKIIWKWEEDALPEQPPNVMLRKWLPQQDLLAHSNVKLFITHGGLLSITEAISYRVPVLAIPIFSDQKLNAETVIKQGFGLSLDFSNVTEENLAQVIGELLNNPTYKINAKYRSKIFHDRMNTSLNTAVYWMEYVIRNKGAAHLRAASLDLWWYEYLLLDVISFFLLTFLSILYSFYILCKIICRKTYI